jgi:hypothetical protein
LLKKKTPLPSGANEGSKSFCGEQKGAAEGALQAAPSLRLSQRSQPPGPPGRFVDPQRTRVPSGLRATRISLNSEETRPRAKTAAGPV